MDLPISVDTTKARVARRAIEAGASIVNDISALTFDHDMSHVVAESGAGIVLMHMQGTPQTMQRAPRYHDVVAEVYAFLSDRIRAAEAAGISRMQIVLDPGIGFGKLQDHNLALLAHVETFTGLGRPLLVGVSRKAFTGHVLGRSHPRSNVWHSRCGRHCRVAWGSSGSRARCRSNARRHHHDTSNRRVEKLPSTGATCVSYSARMACAGWRIWSP